MDPLELSQALIRCPSVTPTDGGAMDILQDALETLGFQGGVLEPLQAGPVIIEDNCFIGARSEVAEGVVVEEGSVLSMGVYIGASTKIVDRDSGEIHFGRVPAYSVVVPGSLAGVELADGAVGHGPEPGVAELGVVPAFELGRHLVDTWATVGSCAQIGKNCHISGGAGIGGVLEPLRTVPVIIEHMQRKRCGR